MAMWQRVIELVGSGGVAVCDDVTGLLVVLARAMEDVEVQACISNVYYVSCRCRQLNF